MWLFVSAVSAWGAAPLGTKWSYQGNLDLDGSPVTNASPGCDFAFSLWDDPVATDPGNQLGSTQTIIGVPVSNGLFTVELNGGDEFGPDAFNGQARWLEVSVCCPSSCTPELLSPRVELTPAPYALALPGLYTQEGPTSPNILGGHPDNRIESGARGAVIAGGGQAGSGNVVYDDFGSIGGGWLNKTGSGDANPANARYATVGGGRGNTASESHSTIGGGNTNTASRSYATVGGGNTNTASQFSATVGGGTNNTASGQYSTVPGGRLNLAGGNYSFAAGFAAKVRDDDSASAYYSGDANGDEGTFVWADSTSADFVSTGPNQFLIRASGGVGIGTNSPAARLHVAGGTDTSLSGGGFLDLGNVAGLNISIDDNEIMARNNGAAATLTLNNEGGNVHLIPTGTGNVGIGTSNPSSTKAVTIHGYDTGTASQWLQLRDAAGTDEWHLNNASGGLNFVESGVADYRLFLQQGGNVGIGTNDPQAGLHVRGASSLGELIVTPGTADSHAQIRLTENASASLGAVMKYNGTANQWQVLGRNTSGETAPHLVVGRDNGNVGIGTTSPDYKLHVATDSASPAIYGYNASASVYSVGVEGRGLNLGVLGVTTSSRGVSGIALSSSGINYGVHGISHSNSGYDFYAGGAGMNYGAASSIRWKTNIKAIDRPLDKLDHLRGVYFDWDPQHGGHHDVGMIAEEVGIVLPEIVNYEENGINANGMDYSKLAPLLVEALKALRAEKDIQIAAQQKRIDELTAGLERMEAMIARLTESYQGDDR